MTDYNDPAVQAALDGEETRDALSLLTQLRDHQHAPLVERVNIVKRWLKLHWSQGWTAAGGPSGAPEPAKTKPPKKEAHR